MAKTRMLNQTAPQVVDWDRLLRQAITAAQACQDPRLKALQMASQQGRAMQVLKRMGIIGEADLRREFPVPTK